MSMIFTSNHLKVLSVMLFVSLPSISALPATSYQQSTDATHVPNRVPTTNTKSNSIEWALEKRTTYNFPKGKRTTTSISKSKTPKNKAPSPKAKSKGHPSSRSGANAHRPPGSKAPPKKKIIPANKVKRPSARPPAPKILSANKVKRPNGRIPPTPGIIGWKPQKPVKTLYLNNPGKIGNKGAIYAVNIGEMRYEAEMDEGSEDDVE